MCYSAMVIQRTMELSRKFNARIDHDAFLDLLEERLNNKRIILPPGLEASYMLAESSVEKKAKVLIEKHYTQTLDSFKNDIVRYQDEIAEIEKKLAIRESKTNLEKRDQKHRQIERFKHKLETFKPPKPNVAVSQIFPRTYTSAIVYRDGHYRITPLRYGVFRQTGSLLKDIQEDTGQNYVLYNCKRESIDEKRFQAIASQMTGVSVLLEKEAQEFLASVWQTEKPPAGKKRLKTKIQHFLTDYGIPDTALSGIQKVEQSIWEEPALSQHAIIVAKQFHEIVYLHDYENRHLRKNETPTAIQLTFSPQPEEDMLFPALVVNSQITENCSINGLAIITDVPNPEVAATGHNRTPIALTQKAAMDFLQCKPTNISDLQELLNQKVRFYFVSEKVA